MYEPAGRQSPYLALMWPAFAVASASQFTAAIARQLIDLAVGAPAVATLDAPHWATQNTIALELETVRLRDFTTGQTGTPALVCAPFSLHSAAIADLASGHSLIATLRDAGLKRLFATDWRSASADMRFLGIDDYLADLNVLVDQIGGPVDLIGLCQGGWMALLYAARFPSKVRKLVLAGAPIDIAAASSGLSVLVNTSPSALFEELVKLDNGRILGRRMLKFWGQDTVSAEDIHRILQTPIPAGSPAFAELEAIFRAWYAWTVDLPGTYYLEVIEKLYRRNELATGHFVALGKKIDLGTIQAPLFLLAARNDELVAPAQLLAAEQLVGTPKHAILARTVPCGHAELFVGKKILTEYWPRIVRWLQQLPSSSVGSN